MGRGGGVEIRESSIRILFSFQGKQRKETLYLDNAPLPPTPANMKYAGRVAIEIRKKITTGEFDYADYFPHSPMAKKLAPDSLSNIMDAWFEQLGGLKPSTMTTYRRMKDNFWKQKLGHRIINTIKPSDITTALKSGEWGSGKTRNNHLSMLSTVFNFALLDELIDKNPCDRVDSVKWQKPEIDPFSLDEANIIVAHMREKFPEQSANLYETAFFTGLRTSEAIGLEWPQVDFNEGTITIMQGYVTDSLEDTKTSQVRVVRLNSRALAAIKKQKAWTFLLPPDADGRQAVFHDPGTGKPWAYEQNARKRYWTPALKELGIRYRRPYNTRHTYATVGLMAGVNPAYMANQLGHSLEMFFKVYAKWITGKQDESEMLKIEGKIGASSQISPELTLKKKKGRD